MLLKSIASLAQSLEGGKLHTLELDGVPPAMCCLLFETHFPALAHLTLKAYSIDRKVQSQLDEETTTLLVTFLRKHASTLVTFVTCNTFASSSPFHGMEPFALPKLHEIVFCDFTLPSYAVSDLVAFIRFEKLVNPAGLRVLDFSTWRLEDDTHSVTAPDWIEKHAGTLRIVGLPQDYWHMILNTKLPKLPHFGRTSLATHISRPDHSAAVAMLRRASEGHARLASARFRSLGTAAQLGNCAPFAHRSRATPP